MNSLFADTEEWGQVFIIDSDALIDIKVEIRAAEQWNVGVDIVHVTENHKLMMPIRNCSATVLSVKLWKVPMATPPVATKVFLCQAPCRVTPTRLARLTGTRWAIETCFQEGKQLLGPGDYEGRIWQGWHRHMILCMLMHLFLLQGKLALKKQPGLTLYQVAEALEAVLALFRHLLRDGRTILAEVLSACRAARPVPTPGDTWRNSHLNLSLQR